ncbi:MAG: hypothetical protein N3A61_04595, partial [Ignavibacteria bacterium]|nr:hypothetical protein [Ignavibacteria bacterium]
LNVKTKKSNFDKGIDNLANLLSLSNLNQISNYLNQAENFIENNVNLRLVWINLILLIKDAFKK